MKHNTKLLAIASLLGCIIGNVYADDYSEQLAFSDGSNATLNFSFDLGTGYFTNVFGIVSGSPELSANGKITEEFGTYWQSATYNAEIPAYNNISETPGTSFALFNSNNATNWINTPAIFEYFLIQNNQLQVDVTNNGINAATLFYPDLGYTVPNLNSLNSYSLIDITVNPDGNSSAIFSSSVPLPSSLILFSSAVLGLVITGTKKPKKLTA